MTRQQVLDDIKQTFGIVPEWLAGLPDSVLEQEWSILKSFQFAETAIPNKYKDLIGLGVAAQMQCPYCVHFHTAAAKFWGASDEEIGEALELAKCTSGWSTFVGGQGYDLEKFRRETAQILEHIKASRARKAA